jgi:hypothetical protein
MNWSAPYKISPFLLWFAVGPFILANCTQNPADTPGNSVDSPAPGALAATPAPTRTRPSLSTPTATVTPTKAPATPTVALVIDEESVLFACLSKRGEDFGPAGPWMMLEQATVSQPSDGLMELPGGNYHVCAYALITNQSASLTLQLAIRSKPFAVVPFRASNVGTNYYFALIDENIPYRYTILNAQDTNVVELAVLGPEGEVLRQERLRILGKPPESQPTPTKKK